MTNEFLQEIACPSCRNPIDIREHGRHIQCDACGNHYIVEGHLCPYCQTYHRQEVGFCSQCGQPLTRVCRKCYTSNWAGNEYCQQCGSPMDILELLQTSHTKTTADRLNQQMERAKALKAQDEEASRKRMAEMMAQEEARQREVNRRIQKKKEEEMKVLMITIGVVVIFILILLIITLSKVLV